MKDKKVKKLRRKSHLKNILLVALADGEMSWSERMFLVRKAEEFKIKPDSLRQIVKYPEKIKSAFPEDIGKRIEILYDLAEVVLADKIVTSEEIQVCKNIAVKMGIIPESIEQILKDVEKRLVDLV